MKTYLPVLWLLFYFEVQSVAIELSGNAKTIPKKGVIELNGKDILLHGVQK